MHLLERVSCFLRGRLYIIIVLCFVSKQDLLLESVCYWDSLPSFKLVGFELPWLGLRITPTRFPHLKNYRHVQEEDTKPLRVVLLC